GIIRITTPESGVVTKILVKENQTVSNDTPLFTLSNLKFSPVQGDQNNFLQQRKNNLFNSYIVLNEQNKQKIKALKQKKLDYLVEKKHIEDQVTNQLKRVELSQDKVNRFKKLLGTKNITPL